MSDDDPNASPEPLGRIALKQVRVSRAEVEARNREQSGARGKPSNPMNRLVPYLDLFSRLSDDELVRLARASAATVEGLRQQIDEVNRALSRFADLIPRLNDDELSRLTGASTKTIRFWRLSQPRHLQGDTRRQSNPDLTPAPQPLPRRESSAHHARAEDASESSSSNPSMSSSIPSSSGASLSGPSPAAAPSSPPSSPPTLYDDPAPDESSTFVIDTIE